MNTRDPDTQPDTLAVTDRDEVVTAMEPLLLTAASRGG